MAFPRLVRQSEGLQRIPHPKDFGLEDVIHAIFGHSVNKFRDFTEEGYHTALCDDKETEGSSVLDYARNIIEHPETDIHAIKSRQEILESFMAHPQLVTVVLNKRIRRHPEYQQSFNWENDTWGQRFNDVVERGTSYLDFVSQLSAELPESDNPELKTFKDYVHTLLAEGERIEALRVALEDIQKPGRVEVKTVFLGKCNYFYGNKIDWTMENPTVCGIFASGKEQTIIDNIRDRWSRIFLGIPYDSLFAHAAHQIKSEGGRDLVSWQTPVELEVSVDEERGTVEGKATYQTLDLVGTVLSFKKKTKPVVTQINFGTGNVSARIFSTAMTYLKYQEYSTFLARYNKDIKEFAKAVVELRYIAIAAEYFTRLREQGVPVTMPVLVASDDNRMTVKDLIEPNLLREKNLRDIVANDVNAETAGNLYVITGPNNNGKTTYMNAVGIAQAMGQAGLMVFAQEATISPRDNVYTHYIRPGDLVVGESRYAHELSRIKEIMERATGNSLILMDELCSGTSPEDARQEVDAVIRTIGELGATAYVATHFHTVTETATELPYGRNLHCVTRGDGDDVAYTFRIQEGASQQSIGMYLARKMGADRSGLHTLLTERVEKEGLQLRK